MAVCCDGRVDTLDNPAGKKRNADAMESKESQHPQKVVRAATIVDVTTNGDVLLKVGTGRDALDIRVSGVVITGASEVFSRMLSSGFKEAETGVIQLPEDLPHAVLHFCCIIHGKTDELTMMKADIIRGLIVFADKYQCQEAIGPYLLKTLRDYVDWSNVVIEAPTAAPQFPILPTGIGIEDMIAFAVIFKIDSLLWRTTKAFMVSSEHPLKIIGYEVDLPALQCGDLHLYDLLNAGRREYIRSLIKGGIRSFVEAVSSVNEGCSCIAGMAKLGAFMIQLQGAGINIGEVEDFQNGGSWKAAADALRTASKFDLTKHDVDPKCGDRNTCVRWDSLFKTYNSLTATMRYGIWVKRSEISGVCLRCLSEYGDDCLSRSEVCMRHPSGDFGAGNTAL